MNREKLIEAGIDYDEGVARFAGKPELYEKYLNKLFLGKTMQTMLQQLEQKDMEGAFRSAHDLKGNTGNLSVTALYQAVCALVEVLRTRQAAQEEYMPAVLQVKTTYEQARLAVMGAEA